MSWNGIYLRATAQNFDEIVVIAGELGVGLELQMFAPPASYNDGTEAAIKRYGAVLSDFAGPVTFHAPFIDLSITSPDSYIRDYSYGLFAFAFDRAIDWGASKMIVHSGYNPLIAYKKYRDEFACDFAGAIAPFIERAADNGLIICVENIFEDNPDIVAGIADAAGTPNVKVCLDIGHAHIFTSIGLNDWVAKLGERIAYVHLHDNNGVFDTHLLPGEGSADIEGVLKELARLDPKPGFGLEITASVERLEGVVSYLRQFE
jgi:sugar phosphate isomerase/epimerase